jgi:hypothetical protein
MGQSSGPEGRKSCRETSTGLMVSFLAFPMSSSSLAPRLKTGTHPGRAQKSDDGRWLHLFFNFQDFCQYSMDRPGTARVRLLIHFILGNLICLLLIAFDTFSPSWHIHWDDSGKIMSTLHSVCSIERSTSGILCAVHHVSQRIYRWTFINWRG